MIFRGTLETFKQLHSTRVTEARKSTLKKNKLPAHNRQTTPPQPTFSPGAGGTGTGARRAPSQAAPVGRSPHGRGI